MVGNTNVRFFIFCTIFGIVFAKTSTSVSPTSPSPCGEYEETKECPRACGTNCSDVYSLNSCFDMCWEEPKCECIAGYVYSDILGKCVLIEDCPRKEIVCPPNQKYIKCKSKNPCKPGCVCRKGFKLDIPTGQCYSGSALCPDPNSQWDACANACSHKTCRTIDEPIYCAFVLKCIGACVCNEPYIYDEDSKTCVTEDYCRI